MADGTIWVGDDRLIGRQEIIRGDCLEVMESRVTAASVDVVVTSPPYNLNLAYSFYDDARTEEDYLTWLTRIAIRIKNVLKSDGSFFLNISGSNSQPWVPFEVVVRLRKVGFSLQNHVTWIKSITVNDESSGHFKPISGKRFMHHNHEHVFHLTLSNLVELDRLSIGIPFQDNPTSPKRSRPRSSVQGQHLVHSLSNR